MHENSPRCAPARARRRGGLPRRARFAAAALGLAGLSPGLGAQSLAPAFAEDSLVAAPTTHWPTNGGNWFNQRYSALDAIDSDNVGELEGVWRTRLDGSGVGPQYSGEAQPLVYDGVIYIVTGADDAFALDVETGEILWRYDADLDPVNDIVCCGWTSRGLALGDGKVFLGRLDGKLVALDQRTGEVVWSVQAERWQDGFSITSAPLYYDGLVITGFAGAEYGVRGRVKAFDAETGAPVWTFYTIPGPGEPGHETWPEDNDVWRDGGGTVWQTPAVDPELGLLYFSTGNPGPDFDGSVRAGDNLYTSSIVAVDVKTGEYRWHYQQVHHDLWDLDSANPVVLFDIELYGETKKGIAEASKSGWLYVLDRETGDPLVGIYERPVPQEPRQATAATQPHPHGDAFVPQSIEIPPEGTKLVNGGRLFTPYWGEEPIALKPSLYGGANWAPSSYDPESGLVYVCATDRSSTYRAVPAGPERPRPGELYTGGTFAKTSIPGLGTFTALDVRTNRIVWQQQWSAPCYSGSTATAGGLVFVGRNDGRLTALDSASGDKLWEFQTGAGMNAPVSVFEHAGHEYVVAYSAGNTFAGTAKGDSVWLFGLDGTLGPADPPRAILTFSGPAEGEPDLANGRAVYDSACTFCHGETGTGGHGGGPSLADVPGTGAVVQMVAEGRNEMPPFAGTLDAVDIRDVAAYVVELAGD